MKGVAVAGTILFRMILLELFKVFVLSLVGITGILLMAGIIAEASQQGLGPMQILAAIPLLVPSTLPYTIPATTLFATCVVYGRLSSDNEILAIKTSGVNVLHVVKPGLILGVVMSLGTLGLYYHIIPATHRMLRMMAFHNAEELLYTLLRRDQAINSPQLPYAIFVKGMQGQKLINPVLKKKGERGQIDVVAHAREADLHVDARQNLLMIHMRIGVAIMKDGGRAVFDDKTFDMEMPSGFFKGENVRARDMTWPQLDQEMQDLQGKMDEVAVETLAATARQMEINAPADLPRHIRQLKAKQKHLAHLKRIIWVEMLMRPSLSFGCLCFILVGCPIGIMFSRGDYLGAFITCFLPIVIVYYPLMLCGTNMAKEGRINEILLVFAADIVVGLGGLTLFRWLLKH
jgi:lipopolysaccharide export system permease protein